LKRDDWRRTRREIGMACTRVRRTIFLWVDHGDQSRQGRWRTPLEEHVGGCPHCREQAQRVARLVILLRTRCERRAAPESLHERIRTLLSGLGVE